MFPPSKTLFLVALILSAFAVWLIVFRRNPIPASVAVASSPALTEVKPASTVLPDESKSEAVPATILAVDQATNPADLSTPVAPVQRQNFNHSGFDQAHIPMEPAPPVNEPAATARMYAAHAPLRTGEVADPDSKTNRKILQTMVTKALARTASRTAPLTSAKP